MRAVPVYRVTPSGELSRYLYATSPETVWCAMSVISAPVSLAAGLKQFYRSTHKHLALVSEYISKVKSNIDYCRRQGL